MREGGRQESERRRELGMMKSVENISRSELYNMIHAGVLHIQYS